MSDVAQSQSAGDSSGWGSGPQGGRCSLETSSAGLERRSQAGTRGAGAAVPRLGALEHPSAEPAWTHQGRSGLPAFLTSLSP